MALENSRKENSLLGFQYEPALDKQPSQTFNQ